MNILATLVAEFDWGILLVSDSQSSEIVPPWVDDDTLVTHAKSALVSRVRHAEEGWARVVVSTDQMDSSLVDYFTGLVDISSGVLVVSNATGASMVEVSVVPGRHEVRVLANDPREPDFVNLVLRLRNETGLEAPWV